MRDLVALVAGLLVVVFLGGCGGRSASPGAPVSQSGAAGDGTVAATAESSQAPDAPAAPAVVEETRQIPAEGLPIDNYLASLDGGRIELPAPKNWSPLARDSKFVVRFFKEDPNGLPRIEITAEDKVLGGLSTVTADNVRQFAQVVADELQGKKLIEPVIPMVIGSTPCARYVLKVELKMAKQGSVVAERQTLVVPRGGRLYTIHLLVWPNALLADRDAAYAVAAGLRAPQP